MMSSKWEKAVIKDDMLERLNQNQIPAERDELKFIDDVLMNMKEQK